MMPATKKCRLLVVLIVAATLLTHSEGFTAMYKSNPTTTKHFAQTPTSSSDPAFDTVMRFELKRELLECADQFQELQREMFARQAEEKKNKPKRKWFRRNKGEQQEDRMGGLYGGQSLGAVQVDLGDKGEEVVGLAEELSAYSRIANPTFGWMGYGGGTPEECVLDGKWKLRFTSGADATFPDNPIRGKATTSQLVNATEGTFTNVVDFEKGKVKGFRVVVEGKACSDTDMDLNFKKIVIHRNSRFPRLLGRITIPLPSFRFLSVIARVVTRGKSTSTGPGFQIRYVDNDMRMHKTRDGIWFIQTRIKEE